MGNNRSSSIENNKGKILTQQEISLLLKSPDPPQVFIDGLMTWDLYTSEYYKKTIHLLGERHVKKSCNEEYIKKNFPNSKVITAENVFFEMLETAKKNNKQIDVFLEAGYNPKNKIFKNFPDDLYSYKDSYLIETIRSLINKYKCSINIPGQIENCEFPNVRFHSSDVRETRNTIVLYLSMVYNYMENCFGKDNKDNDSCVSLLENITNFHQRSIDMDKVLQETKIMKQLKNIPEEYREVKELLLKNYKNSLKEYLPFFTSNKLLNIINFYKDKKLKIVNTKDFTYNHLIKNTVEYGNSLLQKLRQLKTEEEFEKIKNSVSVIYENQKKMYNLEYDKFPDDDENIKNMSKAIKKHINQSIYPIDLGSSEKLERENNPLQLYAINNLLQKSNFNKSELLLINLENYLGSLKYKDENYYIDNEEYLNIWKPTNLYISLMDLYLFGRVFRRFNKKEGKYSEEPKNIIIYAGDLHIQNYKIMLDKLDFKKKIGREQLIDNCLKR
jgi:hypothetical protein